MLEKWPTHSIAPWNMWHFLLRFNFKRVKLNLKWSVAAIFELQLFHVWGKGERLISMMQTLFHRRNFANLSLFCRYFYSNCRIALQFNSCTCSINLRLWQVMLHPQIRIILISSMFQIEEGTSTQAAFSEELTILWNRHLRICFPEQDKCRWFYILLILINETFCHLLFYSYLMFHSFLTFRL